MLVNEIIAEILADKPMNIARFMELCLYHPHFGYYKTKQPLGNDFITSPEISQIFGECIGVWCALQWQKMGAPKVFNLVEIGAGRGTLMQDVLSVIGRFKPQIHIIEINPVLIDEQKETLKDFQVSWHETLETLPKNPNIIFSNEFLDCLPIQQFQKQNNVWHERLVGVRKDELMFGLGAPFKADWEGVFKETCPSLPKVLAQIPAHSSALFIDYGYEKGWKDTLQAMLKGEYVNPLEKCGEVDLTAHVDFNALKKEAESQGFKTGKIKTQFDFLMEHGAKERFEILLTKNPLLQAELHNGYNRITNIASQTGMGLLFKTLEISH